MRLKALDLIAVAVFTFSLFVLVVLFFYDTIGAWNFANPTVWEQQRFSMIALGNGAQFFYSHFFSRIFGGEGILFGRNALISLLMLLGSFFVLNRRVGWKKDVTHTVAVGLTATLAFEILLMVYQPFYLSWYVINPQAGTPLAWFTNLDLLIVSALGLPVVILLSLLERQNENH